MIKPNQDFVSNLKTFAFALLILNSLILFVLNGVEARDKGDDIILTKGKLIMRGGKGKGNLILDTGSKSSEHHAPMMHMMPMMGHHFNPFSFYPMQSQHHHQPPMMIHPVYVEDHSAMHHQPEQHHVYHHEEPQYQHHEMQYNHHEVPQHHEMHHEQPHQEMGHEMEHEQMHQMGHHYEPESHHEQEEGHSHGGYESNPMMSMMMHGSGQMPAYQHLAAMQAAAQQPANYALQLDAQSFPEQQKQQVDIMQQQQHQGNQQESRPQQASASEQQNKKTSLLGSSSNNPLVAIIRPLFSRSPAKQKKP